METWGTIVAYICCIGVWIRFTPYWSKLLIRRRWVEDDLLPMVSVIVPARNEAAVIHKLLDSLLQLGYPKLEVIVVDDRSTDHTRQIAEQYPVQVMTAPPKPSGWIGKSWACHVGASFARGSLLLFTDADTIHRPGSLRNAVQFLMRTKSKLVSAPSYHLNELWWEKFLGPFFCLIQAGATPYDKLHVDHAYALGQYLLIEKDFYQSFGGHAAVKAELADDASIAKATMKHGGKYMMYTGKPLCDVQMYRSFSEFTKGWLRILRLGMQELHLPVVLYTMLPLLALNMTNLPHMTWFVWLPTLLTLLCFSFVQRRIGRFSFLGLLLFPFSVLLFVSMACYAVVCQWFNIPLDWRGRVYTPGHAPVSVNKAEAA